MADKLSGIQNAQNRSMTFQERFGFLIFVSKFILSKFGLFFVFFLIHLSSRGALSHKSISQLKLPCWGADIWSLSEQSKTDLQLYNKSQLHLVKSYEKTGTGLDKIGGKSGGFLSPEETDPKGSPPGEVLSTESLGLPDKELCPGAFPPPQVSNSENPFFQQIRNYCIIATIVTLFLNPQQTKYFGGLAVVLKQAGFFTKYSKSEKMVYIFSWLFVILFFYSSIHLTYSIRSSSILKLIP